MFYLGLLMLVSQSASSCSDCTGSNVTCVDGECLSRCVKATSLGECQECRDSKFYGKQCELFCPSTCLNSRCQLGNRGPECTDGCVAGKKGVSCGVNCSTSCLRCERYSNKCVGSCRQKGFYGDYCNRSCPVNCDGNCNKDTGQCDDCKPGYAGRYCTARCSTNCDYDCDVSTCSGVCVDGYRGENCEETCPPFCGDSGCDRDTGQCTNCKPGYRGIYCKETCTHTCGDSGCDRDSGQCTSCKPGYRGIYCKETCTHTCGDSGCDRDSGQCTSCKPGYRGIFCDQTSTEKDIIYGLLIAVCILGTSIFITVSIGIFYLVKKRRRRHRNSTPSMHYLSPPDAASSDQYWTHKYWDIEDENLDRNSSGNAAPAQHIQSLPPPCPLPLNQRYRRPQSSRRSAAGGQGQCAAIDFHADCDEVFVNHLYKSNVTDTSAPPVPSTSSCSSV